jgi:hypothetical protein
MVMMIMWAIVPIIVSACFWSARWPTLAQELTRPFTRTRLVRVMLSGFALDAGNSFAAFVIAGLSILLLRWPVALGEAARLLIFVASIQFVLFAIAVWLLRLRSNWISILTLQLLVIGVVILLMPTVEKSSQQSISWILSRSAIFIMCGAAVFFDAYRRWLKTDFD